MTLTLEEKWPMSWRERMDAMKVGEFIEIDDRISNSVSCIASKHFHATGRKRFTIKRDPETGVKKIWRKNDIIKEVKDEYNSG